MPANDDTCVQVLDSWHKDYAESMNGLTSSVWRQREYTPLPETQGSRHSTKFNSCLGLHHCHLPWENTEAEILCFEAMSLYLYCKSRRHEGIKPLFRRGNINKRREEYTAHEVLNSCRSYSSRPLVGSAAGKRKHKKQTKNTGENMELKKILI